MKPRPDEAGVKRRIAEAVEKLSKHLAARPTPKAQDDDHAQRMAEAIDILCKHLAISEQDATDCLRAIADETRRTMQEVSESLVLGGEMLRPSQPKPARAGRRSSRRGSPGL